MNAGVVGEFGVEGRGENVALSQTDHTPINLGLDRGVRPDIGDERPTDEHERKVLDVTEIGLAMAGTTALRSAQAVELV